MADKAISELNSAEQITSTDLFVLEQNSTAKKLPGQVLLNWLTAAADGHGGVQSVEKTSTSGLVDTYTMTLADQTAITFALSNGKGVESMVKRSTSGLVVTWRMTYNDGTYVDIPITNGSKGNKGDNAYAYFKFASVEPTSASHDFGDTPDAWIGWYTGTSATAPTDWTAYTWYKTKGDTGNTGDAASLVAQSVTYQVGDSGTITPSGSWSSSIPTVAQGKYLWTRTIITFNSGSPIVMYSVAHSGRDGSGSVTTVNDIAPDSNGNVEIAAVMTVNETTPDSSGNVNLSFTDLVWDNAPCALFAGILSDGKLRGCAITTSGNVVTVAPGHIIVAGHEIELTAARSTTLTQSSGYARVKIKIDTNSSSQLSWAVDYATSVSGFSALTQGDINGGDDSVYEAEVCTVQLSSSVISSVVSSMGRAAARGVIVTDTDPGEGATVPYADGVLIAVV